MVLSSLCLPFGRFFHFGSAAGGMSAARTLMLSSPCLPFGGGRLPFLKSARTSMLSLNWVFVVDLGFGAGPGFVDGAAKAFGSTLKPAASVKVKMSFLYKAISLKI